jgi:hypothetical protein
MKLVCKNCDEDCLPYFMLNGHKWFVCIEVDRMNGSERLGAEPEDSSETQSYFNQLGALGRIKEVTLATKTLKALNEVFDCMECKQRSCVGVL